ncbi:asparaginase [Micrococcales bacterium 31B]|nr:asparaginase [Micrococcales bacterium 31B]
MHYLATGGTIASSTATDQGGAGASAPTEGVSPRLTAEDLVSSVGALPAGIAVTAEQFEQTASTNLTFEHLVALSARATMALRDGAHGVVITQGTDTIEETSFALGLLNPTDRPVIVTGAMRNPTLAGADGAANILGALLCAGAEALAGLPAVVVFNDEIHDPWFVRKAHTSSTATFTSGPTAGPLGWIHEGQPRLAHRPSPPPRVLPRTDCPPIAMVPLSLGDPLHYLADLPRLGYAGVVLDAFGGGHVSASHMRAITRLAAEIPVVIGSRTGSGEILRSTYNFEGSEMSLLRAGCVSAGVLTSRKARVALALLSAETPDDPLRRWKEFTERY